MAKCSCARVCAAICSILLTIFLCVLIVLVVLLIWPSDQPIDTYELSELTDSAFSRCNDVQNRLEKAERLLENHIFGPEALAKSPEGKLYTSTKDGQIVEIVDDKISKTFRMHSSARTNNPDVVCDGSYETTPICGRPLGIRYRNGKLYILDPYVGFYAIDLENHSRNYTTLLFGVDELTKFPNDFDFIDDNRIVFSESSTSHTFIEYALAFLRGEADGRLSEFNLITKKHKTLLEGLFFANGVLVTPDKQSVLVAELGLARIHKVSLVGAKTELSFVDNLLGLPDNIRLTDDLLHFWVPMPIVRHVGSYTFMGNNAWIRKLIYQVFSKKTLFKKYVSWITSDYGLFAKVRLSDGQIVECWQDASGEQMAHITHVMEMNNALYLAIPQFNSMRPGYLCRVCETVWTGSSFKSHQLTHSLMTDLPYKCSICPKQFAQTANLTRHLLLHSGKRPFKCAYCEKAFRVKFANIAHERTHTGKRPFECEKCGAAFNQIVALQVHERLHNGAKPFACGACEESYRSRHELTDHERTQCGNVPFKCKYAGCTYVSFRTSNVNSHLSFMHKNGF